MSRRKQGRPQQRLTLDAVEQENDLLVCGDCQTNFKLRDITKFIRHKVNKCNKENLKCDDETADDGEEEDGDAVISTKRTPISAPIARKESTDVAKSPRQSLNVDIKKEEEQENGGDDDDDVKEVKERPPLRLKQGVDANTNTTNSEPLKLSCESCRKTVSSAWQLLQHAQREHGMRIYVTASRDSSTPFQSPRGLQKSPKSDDTGSDKVKDERRREDMSGREPMRSDSAEPLRTTPSAGSISSGEGPLSAHQSPHNPFIFPRGPFPDVRHPLSPITGMGPLRPPSDLRLDFVSDPFSHHRPDLPLFNLPGFPHGSSAPFNPYEPRGHMTLDDFYSKRLRMLASSNSPSPGRKHTPPFTQAASLSPRVPPSNIFSSSSTHSTNSSDLEKRHDGTRSLTPPGNHKSCEFCGKTFRFQSNLIVHRRSHTGEKPFKCPICPHACTQQSKLKRHMKTHAGKGGMSMGSNMSTMSEGSHASSSSTPDSNRLGNEDDDEPDDEEEEEEEELEEDEMEIEAMNELREMKAEQKAERSDMAARLLNRRIEETSEITKDSEAGNKKSLISEVMDTTGLADIPNYNEALKLAIEEKFADSPTDDHSRESLSPSEGSPNEEGKKKEDDKEPERGLKREKSSDSIMSITKMIKKEPHEKAGTPPVSAQQMINNFTDSSPFYRNFWLAGPGSRPPDFFSQFPLPRFTLGDGIDIQRNGFGLPSSGAETTSNQLSSPSGSAPSTPISINGTTPPNSTPRKEKPRNDTCEYCGKIFKNCSNLTVHRRSHTGEKPYKCMLCSYACAQSSKLTRHMKTHGRFGKDVYKCKFCQMPFSVPSTLEKHMRKCVGNANMEDMDDTGSNSDAASTSDSYSAISMTTSSMSLPTAPLPHSASFGLGHPFSVPIHSQLDKNMRKMFEQSIIDADSEDTRGSSNDVTSLTEHASGHPAIFTSASSAPLLSASLALPVTFPTLPLKHHDKHQGKLLENQSDKIGNGDESSLSDNLLSVTSTVGMSLPASFTSLISKRGKGDGSSAEDSSHKDSMVSLSSTSLMFPSLTSSQSAAISAGIPIGLSANLGGMGSARVKFESNLNAGIVGLSANMGGMSSTGIKMDSNRGTSSTSI